MAQEKKGIWSNPLISSKINFLNVRPPEMLIGYLNNPILPAEHRH